MDDMDYGDDWREKLRNELSPYAAFYAVGLMWLLVSNSIAAWGGFFGFAMTAVTIAIGGTVCTMVSLMMLWRALMFGIDDGRIVPMVTAGATAVTLLIFAFALAFPAVALGRVIGEIQVSAISGLSAFT